jgi:hypothetical protein
MEFTEMTPELLAMIKDVPAATDEHKETNRDKLVSLIGSFPLHTDDRGPDNAVLHDAFSGDYNERTEAIYQLVDDLLAEISQQDASLIASIVAERKVEAWHDIRTAPDACHFLATYWSADFSEWVVGVVMNPLSGPWTHWQPLPTPPALSALEERL